jgi:hypothetical protein
MLRRIFKKRFFEDSFKLIVDLKWRRRNKKGYLKY